jgi:hypothetical protein
MPDRKERRGGRNDPRFASQGASGGAATPSGSRQSEGCFAVRGHLNALRLGSSSATETRPIIIAIEMMRIAIFRTRGMGSFRVYRRVLSIG